MRIIVLLALCLIAPTSVAEVGRHGDGHEKLHHWYSTLVDPDGISCCNDHDCRPTDHRALSDGSIEVMVDGVWTPVPPEKILKRSSPDLGTHVCAPPPEFPYAERHIFCVVLGNGV